MKKIILLFIVSVIIAACVNEKKKFIAGQWEYQQATISTKTVVDTSKKDAMANFVDQLTLQTVDLYFKEDGTFKTIKDSADFEKGTFEIKSKILTLEYKDGEKVELEDYEIITLNDSVMKLRNAKDLVIDYKKIKK